jgi:hypothetical protein
MKSVLKVIIASLALALFISKYIFLPLILIIILGIAIYIILLVLIRYFDREELKIMQEIFKKK